MDKKINLLILLASLSLVSCGGKIISPSEELPSESESVEPSEEPSEEPSLTPSEEEPSEEPSEEISEEHSHTYSEWTITLAPTLTTTGEATRTCSGCDEPEVVTIPSLSDESVWTKTTSKEPTCEETGLDVYTSVYGEVNVVIDPIHHLYSEIYYTWSSDFSSCTAKAICANDSKHVVEEVSRSSSEVLRETSCSEEGLIKYVASFDNDLFVTQEKNQSIPMSEHLYEDNLIGQYVCESCGHKVNYQMHKAPFSVMNYYNQNVGDVADFSGWQSSFKIVEKTDDVIWLGKVDNGYSVAYFNAFDMVDDNPVFYSNYLYRAHIRTYDSAEANTTMQLYIGTNSHKYAIPMYSNSGINLFDTVSNNFVPDAFHFTEEIKTNEEFVVSILNRDLGNGNAKLSLYLNSTLIFALDVPSAPNGDFGFDVLDGANWEIGSPEVYCLDI